MTGIDLTPGLIEIARERVPDGRFVVGGMDDLPVDDGGGGCFRPGRTSRAPAT